MQLRTFFIQHRWCDACTLSIFSTMTHRERAILSFCRATITLYRTFILFFSLSHCLLHLTLESRPPACFLSCTIFFFSFLSSSGGITKLHNEAEKIDNSTTFFCLKLEFRVFWLVWMSILWHFPMQFHAASIAQQVNGHESVVVRCNFDRLEFHLDSIKNMQKILFHFLQLLRLQIISWNTLPELKEIVLHNMQTNLYSFTILFCQNFHFFQFCFTIEWKFSIPHTQSFNFRV